MRILIVAATPGECTLNLFQFQHLEIDTLITGAGIAATAYQLGKVLRSGEYDLAINIGIAGSFNREITLGEVVHVIEDRFSDFGAEDGDQFLSASSIGLSDEEMYLPTYEISNLTLRKVKAITVNTVHGEEGSIQSMINSLNPDIETMEGAAFFFVCKMESTPCLQIRAISNNIERRNRNNWNIPLAIKNLEKNINNFLATLNNSN